MCKRSNKSSDQLRPRGRGRRRGVIRSPSFTAPDDVRRNTVMSLPAPRELTSGSQSLRSASNAHRHTPHMEAYPPSLHT